MSINNIGSMNSILKNFSADKWSKQIEFKDTNTKSLNIPDKVNLDKHESRESFVDLLSNSISKVNNLQHDANKAVEQLVTGKSKNIHETLLAVEQAEMAFKMMNQVRSKVIDAYKEVMRMQV
ncbi:MAG: flagellar hook-basal body complex protein FliE [Bdellovibrionales bacterium]|mgnify:CR=1 FL=1|jgi:flagellar hook-basal body complex protein FliE|nr:flagellar hook-basal body complex protein FliE [Bdellovibrionales bacterium]